MPKLCLAEYVLNSVECEHFEGQWVWFDRLLTLISMKMEHSRPLQVCTNVCIIFAHTGAGARGLKLECNPFCRNIFKFILWPSIPSRGERQQSPYSMSPETWRFYKRACLVPIKAVSSFDGQRKWAQLFLNFKQTVAQDPSLCFLEIFRTHCGRFCLW